MVFQYYLTHKQSQKDKIPVKILFPKYVQKNQ